MLRFCLYSTVMLLGGSNNVMFFVCTPVLYCDIVMFIHCQIERYVFGCKVTEKVSLLYHTSL